MAKDAIKMKGKVVKVHSTTQFEIKLDENDMMIQGVISGKMKKHRIKILPGDGVDVEISPYDLTKGRIVYRHK